MGLAAHKLGGLQPEPTLAPERRWWQNDGAPLLPLKSHISLILLHVTLVTFHAWRMWQMSRVRRTLTYLQWMWHMLIMDMILHKNIWFEHCPSQRGGGAVPGPYVMFSKIIRGVWSNKAYTVTFFDVDMTQRNTSQYLSWMFDLTRRVYSDPFNSWRSSNLGVPPLFHTMHHTKSHSFFTIQNTMQDTQYTLHYTFVLWYTIMWFLGIATETLSL